MHTSAYLLVAATAWAALSPAVVAAAVAGQSLNTSQEFNLRTQLKPDQDGKDAFDNLWLYAHHTGAGMNDALFTANRSEAIPGSLNATAGLETDDGTPLSGIVFDLGNPDIPWGLQPQPNVDFYAAWQPVRINAGNTEGTPQSAFFVNETGLQWTNVGNSSTPTSFGGWFVCKWWHGSLDNSSLPGVQLFFRISHFGHLELETCADVDLVPEYI